MKRLLLLAFLLGAAAPAAAQQKMGMWRLESIASSPGTRVILHKGPDKTQVGTFSTDRARMIVDVKNRIEKEAGVSAEIVLMEGRQPNAFATPTSKAGPIVGINLGMVELLGHDRDAYAAVLGHEYAHLTLRHRESRMDRESLRLLGTVALAILFARQGGGYASADAANFATQAVSMTFSREEERDADRTGLGFAAAAGFDPHGAVRVWERMAARGDKTVPFLSSHPASRERVENLRALAGELGAAAAASEAEHSEQGVRIRRVLFGPAESGMVVRVMPEDARTTLRLGDKVVGCYGAAPDAPASGGPASCRSPDGAYAFVVERDGDRVSAVLLRPRQ
jgi:predicted Zn-dependent protease